MNRPMSRSLRALAWLLRYPDDNVRDALPIVREVLHDERATTVARLAELDGLMDRLRAALPLRAEADYVDLFDRGRRTSLHLFEHVHGDSRDRGSAMVDLTQTYERAGLRLAAGELPDHLTVVLEFASTQPPDTAREFLRETAHVVRAIFSALVERGSPYASVLGAVLDLAGERAERVELPAEPALDEAWAEPEAFDGCSTRGLARPGQPQPIEVVRPRRAGGGHRAAA